MTDRELLELAAKAYFPDCANIGHPLDWVRDCYGDWNPLADDGDALRLAVKLDLDIELQEDSVFANGIDVQSYQFFEWHGDDKLAATRRAIVRCSAEIGKNL